MELWKVFPPLLVITIVFFIGCVGEDLDTSIFGQVAEFKIDSIEQMDCGLNYETFTPNQCFLFNIILTNLQDKTINGYYDAHVVNDENLDHLAESHNADCIPLTLNYVHDRVISISPKASQKIFTCFLHEINYGKMYINIYDGTLTQMLNGEIKAQTISLDFNVSDFV